MLFNNFKIVFRQFFRQRTFSFINLLGLITGFTVCLFIAQFVWFEHSFERFNENADRTYRVNLYNTSNGVFTGISSGTVSGLGYDMRHSLSGIDAICRVSSMERAVVSNENRGITNLENRLVFADQSIFDVLAINIIEGDNRRPFKGERSVAISSSIAKKYFGITDVVGKLIDIGFPGSSTQAAPFVIDAVFQDMPPNTAKQFDFILPPENEQQWDENWDWSDVTTYVRLNSENDPEHLSAGLASIVKKHHQDNSGDKYLLEPILDIRLYALDGSGRATMVNFFMILGLIVLLLAWFNYISLSTARFLESMKEVGIRKLVGASRKQLMFRFLTESFLFNAISFLCAIILFIILWPRAASYFHVPSSELLINIPEAYIFFGAFLLIGVATAGLYPAIFLSSFKPLQSIKGKVNEMADRSMLRKILVVTQLTISLILITAIFTIEKQINFIRSQQTGISLDETLVIDRPLVIDGATVSDYQPFRDQLLQQPGVKGVTFASSFPGEEIDWHRVDITLNEEGTGHRYDSRIVAIGTEFLDVFGLKLLSGRNFNPELETDMKVLLVNEAASKMFGFKDINEAVGKIIFVGSRRFEIIGVINDYHFRSFQHQLQPMLFAKGYERAPSYAVKIQPHNVRETVATLEKLWNAEYPGNVFSYYFLDERFEKQYESDQQFSTLTGVFTIMAIVVSFLGLFGLSLYSVSRRIKEIGIRKVFGASVINVVVLLSKDYMKLILIACVIGVPVIYQLVLKWLQKYAYKMTIDVSLFVIPVIILAALTILTVSVKIISAAGKKPIDSLRYE